MMHKHLAAVGVALGLALLSGCAATGDPTSNPTTEASGAPTPTLTQTTEASVTSTPTVTQTTAPEPSVSPTDTWTPEPPEPLPTHTVTPGPEDLLPDGTWLISGRGIGPYHLNDPYMKPGDPDLYPCSFFRTSDSMNGQIMLFDHNNIHWDQSAPQPDLRATLIMASDSFRVSGSFGVDEPAETPPRTAKGIAVGSTMAEVSAAYPDGNYIDGNYSGNGFLIYDGTIPIVFIVDTNTLGIPSEPTHQVRQIMVGYDFVPLDYCS